MAELQIILVLDKTYYLVIGKGEVYRVFLSLSSRGMRDETKAGPHY
jgi:hypothetical protein